MSGPNWGEPRSALGVIGDTFRLYGAFPLLFFVLAAVVVVPYEGLQLALLGSGPSRAAGGGGLLLLVLDFGFVLPLISALHVHAVAAVKEGEQPRIRSVAIQGLRALPVVAAASIAAGLGIFAGTLALIVPGLILLLRWCVVAQAAAIEREGWVPALRRSADLSSDNYKHVFGVLLGVGAITVAPGLALTAAFGAGSTAPARILIGIAVGILTASFAALAEAVLYFELRVRATARHSGALDRGTARERPPGSAGSGPGGAVEEVQTSLDPRAHSDEDRPRGWYVNPAAPRKMHYWGGPGAGGWVGSARTPRKMRRTWEAEVGLQGEA